MTAMMQATDTQMEEHLATELATLKRLTPTLAAEEGKFAVIFGETLIGTFDSYQDALKAGYEKAGLKPFLVKRISTTESISYFTREIPCHT